MTIINTAICRFSLSIFVIGIGLAYCSDSDCEGSNTDSILRVRYELERTPEPRLYITGINLDTIIHRHIPDFNKRWTGIIWRLGRKWWLVNEANCCGVEITIGIYSSVQQTEKHILDHFSGLSAIPKLGTLTRTKIGDNSWFLGIDVTETGTVIFVRKNALVIVSSTKYNVAESIAKMIDDDLINAAPGVQLDSAAVVVPVIDSFTIESKVIKTKEKQPLIIHANDPEKRELSYHVFNEGGIAFNTDITKQKIVIFDKRGKHRISVFVISETNVVAEKEFEIECE